MVWFAMEIRKEKPMGYASFEEWMTGAVVYLVHDRYGNYSKHGFVAVSGYDDSYRLREAVEDLEGGDSDMDNARRYIDNLIAHDKAWLGSGPLPSDACAALEAKMREVQARIISNLKRGLDP